MQVRSFKFRLKPTKSQGSALGDMLLDLCGLYNACLQQRIEAYRRRRISIRYRDQAAELTAVRNSDPEGCGRWSYSVLQQLLRRVDRTYSAFFKRGKGFPRFRSASRFHAATFPVGDGLSLRKNGKLRLIGVPDQIKVVWHRPLPKDAKLGTATISRQQGKWYVIFSVEAAFQDLCGTGSVGVDLGVNSLIATSDGDIVASHQFARKSHKAQRRRQRALARCQKGSKRKIKAKDRLTASCGKIARQRRDHLHKTSRFLVARYQNIAFEDLNMAALTKGMLAKSVHDAAWSTLVQLTTYKAESAGASIVLVDPRGTSQTCPHCGTIKAKTLKVRTHACECGAVMDRDVAAAVVIRQRAFELGPGHGLRTPSQRVAA